MKRETFKLARKIFINNSVTKKEMMLVNDLLDSLLLDQVFTEVMD